MITPDKINNKNKHFIKLGLMGLVVILVLSITIKVINKHNSYSSLKVQSANDFMPRIDTLEKNNLELMLASRVKFYKEVHKEVPLNANALKHKFYSEAYLFHNLSLAEAINTYCAANTVSSAISLANCNVAAKMNNTLYLGYFALSDDLARPNVLKLLGGLLIMLVVIKLVFRSLFLRNFRSNVKSGSVTGSSCA